MEPRRLSGIQGGHVDGPSHQLLRHAERIQEHLILDQATIAIELEGGKFVMHDASTRSMPKFAFTERGRVLAVDQHQVELLLDRLRGVVKHLVSRQHGGFAVHVMRRRKELGRSVKGPVDLVVEHINHKFTMTEPVGFVGPIHHLTNDFLRHDRPAGSWSKSISPSPSSAENSLRHAGVWGAIRVCLPVRKLSQRRSVAFSRCNCAGLRYHQRVGSKRPAACSMTAPSENSVSSSKGRPINCRPSGKPCRSMAPGTEIPGSPAMFTVTVKMSFKYISTGSPPPFSPIPNAADGVAGVSMAWMPLAKQSSKSRLMSVRTR